MRGGGTDQNLVLFNGATIYNPAHLFGFFSAFNPDAVQSVELYKSAIPVRYGGRLASVLEIEGREGSRTKFGGSGGIGLLTSRTSYSDWLLRNLLHWNPAVTLSANKTQTLDFFTSDQAGRYLVVAQSLTPEGRLGSTSFSLKVKPAL